jgi:hypothetical protein
VRRDAVLEAVGRYLPEFLTFVASAYGSTSSLIFSDTIIESAEEIQQGNPFLFCLALHEIVQRVDCEFVSGYLDDVALGDTTQRVIDEVR